MNEAVLVECAMWIYARKDGTGWWTPYVLTQHNPADNPNLNIDEAYSVFAELKRRRLMVHTIVQENGVALPAFKINPTKDDEWQQLVKKKGIWNLWIVPKCMWLLTKTWLLVLFIAAVLISEYLTIKVQEATTSQEKVQNNKIRIEKTQFDRLLQSMKKEPSQDHTANNNQENDTSKIDDNPQNER